MVTIGEQLQLSRRLGTAIGTHRASILSTWLRILRDIPREFYGQPPEAHLEEFAPPALDALIAFLNRGDRKLARRVAISWGNRQDGLGVGLGESIRGILSLGPCVAPLLRRIGLDRGQPLVEGFLAILAEELSRAYTLKLKRALDERAKAIGAVEERLLSLQMVAGAVAQERDQELTLDLIARQVVKLTGADTATVFLPDEEAGVMRAAICITPQGNEAPSEVVPIEGTTVGHVYRSGHLLVADDTDDTPEDAISSGIMAPLRTRDQVIGVLGVEKLDGATFTRADVELLGLFADQAAIALENARLFQETNRRNEEVATLYRIGAVASRSLDLDRILGDALDSTLDALDLETGTVYLLDRNSIRLELRTHRGLPPGPADGEAPAIIRLGDGPLGGIALQGEPLMIDDAREYAQLIAGFPIEPDNDAEVRYVGIPLRAKDRILGVLNVLGTATRGREERARDLALVSSIGDQIGVAVDNAQLLMGREERLSQLTTLNDLLRALTAILDAESLYEAIYLGCSRLFDTSTFYIALVDEVTDSLVARRWYIDGARGHDREGQPLIHGLSPVVIAEGRPILTDDYWAECRQRGVQGSPRFIKGPLSWLGVPMTIGGRLLGTIVIASSTSCYSVEDATLLSAIASGCAVAIENARAYASEQRRVEQLRALNEISRTLVSIREVEYLLPQVATTMRERFDYNHVSILLYDPEDDDLVVQAQANRHPGPSDLGLRIAVGAHVVGRAAATRQPVLINDISRESQFLRTAAVADSRAALAVPIVLSNRLIGVVNVESHRIGAFDADDVSTLQTLADGLAVGIENARLFEAERRRQQELTSILDVTTAATSSLLLDEVLGIVARGLSDAVDGLSCSVYLLDDTGTELIPRAGVGYHGGPLTGPAANLPIALADEAFLREAITSGHAQMTADAANDPRTNKALVRLLSLQSLLAVPLIAKGRPLGIAVVAALRDRYHFTQAQARLVEAIADTAALAVENARLYARSRELATAEERNRLAREIHDTLAQGLTAVTLQLEVADALLDDPERLQEAREKVRRGMEVTRANLEEARRSVMDLRAAPLQDQTLPEALAQLIENARREYGIDGCFRVHEVEGRLPSHLEAGFYRIAQELLSNIGKHAHATQVDMTLKRWNGSLLLAVTDDGVGFDPATPPDAGVTGGFGLVGLRERVALLGGKLQIDSAPDEGTSVRVKVPLPHHETNGRQAEHEVNAAVAATDGVY
jgi:GAF domain-containing protein